MLFEFLEISYVPLKGICEICRNIFFLHNASWKLRRIRETFFQITLVFNKYFSQNFVMQKSTNYMGKTLFLKTFKLANF